MRSVYLWPIAALAGILSISVSNAQSPGCPAPAAGKLAKPVKVDKKARGKFSIDMAPRLSVLTSAAVCDTVAKLNNGSATGAAALGLSSQVLNTQAGRLDLIALPLVEAELQRGLASFRGAWPYATAAKPPRILFRASDAYDAYALPDGTIVMSMGVLDAAESDSEVLFVLAHEYAHLLMGHHLRTVDPNANKGLAGAAATLYSAGSLAMQLRSNRASFSAADLGKVEAAAKQAAVLSEQLKFALDDSFTPNWARDQEDEADALALDLLIGSNSTIDSYAKVFGRLEKMMATQSASRVKRSAVAQGVEKSLGAALKQIASPEMLGSLASGNTGGLRSMGGKALLGFAGGMLGGSGSGVPKDTHLPPAERRQGLAAYFQAGYPTAEPPIDAGALVKRYKALPEYQKATVLKTKYLVARDAYFKQDFAGALAGLKPLGAGTPAAPTFVNFMAALAARDVGNAVQAKQFFEAGRTGKGIPSVQLYESYAEAGIAQRDLEGSKRLLSDAAIRFKDTDHFRNIEIARLVAGGDLTQASQNYTLCLGVKGRDYIPTRCKAAFPQAESQAQPDGTTPKPKLKLPGGLSPF